MNTNKNFEEIAIDVYSTKYAYDIINWLKHKPKTYRIIYDKNIKTYFIGDAEKVIHQNLVEAAFNSGFYSQIKSLEELKHYIYENLFEKDDLLFCIYEPQNLEIIDIENADEGYTRKYVYPFGVIYTYELSPLECFSDFYNALGNYLNSNQLKTKATFKAINRKLESLHSLK